MSDQRTKDDKDLQDFIEFLETLSPETQRSIMAKAEKIAMPRIRSSEQERRSQS